MDALAYSTMLEETLLPFAEDKDPTGMIFQQDNAPAHTANYTKMFFQDEKIELLDWTPRSPDINVIENCWGYLARSVYQGSRQFDTVDDLKEALLYEWENLPLSHIRSLIESMPRRIWELYNKRGSETEY